MRGLDDDWGRNRGFPQTRQDAHSVQPWHHQVENEQIDRGMSLGLDARESGFTPIDRFDVVAETANHRLEQTALDRVVVCNQEGGCHRTSNLAARPSGRMLREEGK